jgi:hypothetical protein
MRESLVAVFAALGIVALSASLATAQRRLNVEDQETIRRTLEFSPGDGLKTLKLDNVEGSIRVTGYDGRNVEMVAHKTIRARSQERLEAAKQEVRLDIVDRTDTIDIYVHHPGHERSTSSSSRSSSTDSGYRVRFDFEIRVPRQAAVRLWTINDGDIEVASIAGDFQVDHVNGSIDMRDISGSGRVNTINGRVRVAFSGNPKRDSRFGSLNGNVDVTFQPDLSADLRFKTFNGGVYTDFPVTALTSVSSPPERRNGKFIYQSNDFQNARVGSGGPTLEFDGFNGNIQILRAK